MIARRFSWQGDGTVNDYTFSCIIVYQLANQTRASGRSKAEDIAAALEPASPAIPTAAADKQHYDDNDQKSCGVHTVLLIADQRDRGQCQVARPCSNNCGAFEKA